MPLQPEPDQLPLFAEGIDMGSLRKEAARLMQESARSANTQRAYALDWQDFKTWCAAAGRRPLPASPETVMLYATDRLKVHKVSTVHRRIAAIVYRHGQDGHSSPYIGAPRALLGAAAREKGRTQTGKAALEAADVKKIAKRLAKLKNREAARDRALLLIAFAAGGMRRSELVALQLADVEVKPEGLLVHIRKSKTDQESKGRTVGAFRGKEPATCAADALQRWLKHRGNEPGHLFPSGRQSKAICPESVGYIVKKRVAEIGLDPANYSAHSIRAGFVTTAAKAGVSDSMIMRQTGHRSAQTVARYVRPASAFAVNALAQAL